MFQGLSNSRLERLDKLITEQSLTRNQYLYRQGDLPTQVFIVSCGEFEVIRNKKGRQKKPEGAYAGSDQDNSIKSLN